jgi:hypothetical protein
MQIENDFCMLNMSDIEKFVKGQAGKSGSYCSDMEASRTRGFTADPDFGSVWERLQGSFDWAFKVMEKQSKVAAVGNVESLTIETEWGLLDGTEIDFDRYMMRDSHCLGRLFMPPSFDGNRVIRVAVGIGSNAMTSAEELARRSAIILRIVKQYEEAGYNVELFGFFPATSLWSRRGASTVGSVVIDCSKSTSGQALAALCSSLLFRTVGFDLLNLIGRDPNSNRTVAHYSEPGLMPVAKADIKRRLGSDTVVIFSGSDDEQIKAAFAENR